jgi:thioredoxin-related protein
MELAAGIHQPAIRQQHPWFLVALVAKTYQSHGRSLSRPARKETANISQPVARIPPILLDTGDLRTEFPAAMNKSTTILRAGMLALATFATAFAGGEGWTSDFEAAKKQAASEKKDLLLDFTGSDWCGWCIKLNKEVFQEEAFKTGVKDKLVLVELDFPKDTSKLSDDTKAQNDKLRDAFKIKGYPSILLCDATGKPYAKTGYQPGGPEKYLTHLNELMAVRAKRDAAFAAADKATDDLEKAKNLMDALKAMDEEIVEIHYGDVVNKIGELDKADSTGFVKERKEAAAKKEAAAAAQAKVGEFMQGTIRPLMMSKDYDKAYTALQEFMKATPEMDDSMKINLSLTVGLAGYVQKGDAEGANKFIDEIATAYPNPQFTSQVDRIKQQVKAQIDQAKGGKDSE